MYLQKEEGPMTENLIVSGGGEHPSLLKEVSLVHGDGICHTKRAARWYGHCHLLQDTVLLILLYVHTVLGRPLESREHLGPITTSVRKQT